MILELVHGCVRRGSSIVLEPGRLTASAPAAIAVIGINGSGKSSLFLHLIDALRHSRGGASIRLDGRAVSLSFVPQEPSFPASLSVRGVVRMYGLVFERLEQEMPGLHLEEIRGRNAGALSVGQRQALAIALALGRSAGLVLLDEPFSALDFRRRIGALDLLHEHRSRGASLVLSSQSASDLIDLCDTYAVIRAGCYVFNGPRTGLEQHAGPSGIERGLLRLLT